MTGLGFGFLLGAVVVLLVWAGLSWSGADDPNAHEAETADDEVSA
jgi:hypothetical protein